MGRVFRLWRGVWKKNERLHWHFVPTPADYGFTVYMDSPETYETIEATVREHYVLGQTTQLAITYGMPDWMLFPSGQTAPITITNTAELVGVMNRKPPHSDVTLLVTLGAKSVAEYQFLCHSDFSIGPTTYSVGGSQDERAKARYESLVFEERLLTSETVMNEIFGEEEMLIFHRVALEMGHADRVIRPHAGGGVVNGMEIIQLDDDDDEMVDVAPMGGSGRLTTSHGPNIPSHHDPVPQVSPSDALSVLWDVGLDLLEYPDFNTVQKEENVGSSDAEFWKAVMDETCNCCEQELTVGNEGREEVAVAERGPLGVIAGTVQSQPSQPAALLEEADSSTGSTTIGTSQLRREGTMKANQVGGSMIIIDDGPVETRKINVTSEGPTTIQSPALNLTLACEHVEGGTQKMDCVNVGDTSSEGSDTDGGF
ncbi:hypothetical protein N665_1041s0009 [Sinapis alba]|nr:hypothetical protein N665_1041s0009 [Sinapis alba]